MAWLFKACVVGVVGIAGRTACCRCGNVLLVYIPEVASVVKVMVYTFFHCTLKFCMVAYGKVLSRTFMAGHAVLSGQK